MVVLGYNYSPRRWVREVAELEGARGTKGNGQGESQPFRSQPHGQGAVFLFAVGDEGGSQFAFFRPPLLHKFELVWAYLLLLFGLWVDGNPLGTPELKNRSYLPLFFCHEGLLRVPAP